MQQKNFHSSQRGYEIVLPDFHIVDKESYADIEKLFWQSADRLHHINIEFSTSASFKTNNRYAIFPCLDLLYQNLIARWNAFSDSTVLEEADLALHLAGQTQITDYKLHMKPFALEGRYIRAFIGGISLGGFRQDAAMRLSGMLLYFARYAGIGIKTAMGMGGVRLKFSKQRAK